MPLRQARAVGNAVLDCTLPDLQGEPRIAHEDVEPQRKGMAVSRSSSTPMTDFETMFQAIWATTTRAATKLRQYGLVRGTLTVFDRASRQYPDRPQYVGCRSTLFDPAV